jgi:hypothetical protein
MTIRELLELLDGCGLVVTDDELIADALAEAGLTLDSIVEPTQ